jgi:hypothetical protein
MSTPLFRKISQEMLSLFQKKISLQKFFELASKLVLDQSADFFRYLRSLTREPQPPLTSTQELDGFFEIITWEFFVFDQALMKIPDLDYFIISDRLRDYAWWVFFDHERYEELRRRSNERLNEYHSFDDLFIAPLSQPSFSTSTIYRCAEYVSAQFGYLKYGPESKILMAALFEHLVKTIDSNVYQTLVRKTDLRLARKVS